MTWSRTDYLSSLRTDDLFPDRISILPTNGWPPFQTDDLFPNIIYILSTNYRLRSDHLHLNRLFPVRMTPRTSDSTLLINLRSSSVNKLMTWSRTDYLSSLWTDDLFPDRISILRTNGWPPFRTDDLFPNIISILRMNYYEFSWTIKPMYVLS